MQRYISIAELQNLKTKYFMTFLYSLNYYFYWLYETNRSFESSNGIYQKLEAFIRSIILMNWFEEWYFHRFRLVVFSFHVVEYFLGWNQWQGLFCFGLLWGRSGTFISFYCISIKLFKLKGIDYNETSIIIGSHLSMSMIVLHFSPIGIRKETFLWITFGFDRSKQTLCNWYPLAMP
jgi:hypothetical protein